MKFRSHANTLVIALLTLCSDSIFGQSPKVAVESVGMTVSDMDRSVAAGMNAFYLRDSDEHNLEVMSLRRGKGDQRWEETTDNLFLGIDHTALGIANTEASLHFYRDLLGLRKAGESENFGTEQEH